MRELTKSVTVYNKHGERIAYFDSESPGIPENRINMMQRPTVSIEANGASTFTFQMNTKSQKWKDISDPENEYLVDGRKYCCLSPNSIAIENETVTVTAEETWNKLSKKYVQAYNVPKEQEGIDDQTVVLLPKSKEPLVVNGVTYHNVPYPRGSAGYNIWAILQGTGWRLAFCDVIADGFDPSQDYGVFNVETDQKDVLYNLEHIRELYGGIFVWDSINQTLSVHDSNKWNNDYGFEIRKGKNLNNLTIEYDNDIITRLYPLGESYLNIAAVNGGKRYLDNFSYTSTIYEGNLQNSDIYDQKQLKFWGEQQLAKLCKPRKTVTADIVDVRTIEGKEHETFDIHDIVTVVYRDGVDEVLTKESLRIISWQYEVFAPYNMSLELGDRKLNFVDFLKQAYESGNTSDGLIDSNGHISSDSIWDYEEDSLLKDHLYKYIHETEHRLEIKVDDVAGSLADFIVEANETFATIDALVQFETETTTAIANLKMYADDTFATIVSLTEFKTETTQAIAGIEQYVDSVEARVTSNTQFIENVDGRVTESFTRIEQVSKRAEAAIDFSAEVDGKVADLKIEVRNNTSTITATADEVNVHATTLNAHSESINVIADCVKVNGAIYAGMLASHDAEIKNLKAKMITTESLKSKNIECAGCFAGTGNFDAGGFKSCNIGSLEVTQTVYFPKKVYFAGYQFHIGKIEAKNGTFHAMTKVM